jgi:hypothetical protein
MDLTAWTPDGVVDLIAVWRWLDGDDTIRLTKAEKLAAYHGVRTGWISGSEFQTRAGVNSLTLRALALTPVPVDRRTGEPLPMLPRERTLTHAGSALVA